MYRFLIVIEKANGDFSAYSPDLPGCVATGRTREQVTRNLGPDTRAKTGHPVRCGPLG